MVRLEKFGSKTLRERQFWGAVVNAFEQKLGLLNQEPKSLLMEADYLWERTRGSLGALSRLLTTVALDLIEDGDADAEFITREHLDSVHLDMASLLDEARARELATTSKKEHANAA